MAYPVKSKAKQRRIEKKTVFVIRDGSRVILNKRPEKGLLADSMISKCGGASE